MHILEIIGLLVTLCGLGAAIGLITLSIIEQIGDEEDDSDR